MKRIFCLGRMMPSTTRTRITTPAVGVVPAVEQQHPQRLVRTRPWAAAPWPPPLRGSRRSPCPPWPRRGSPPRRRCRSTSSICRAHVLGIGGGQVDLVDDRHDGEVVVHRQVDVGQRLRLDALRRVDDQHGAFAGGQRARHLVVEVDVPGRVDEVELVGLAVAGFVGSRTVAALMVIPRSRSRSMLSMNCALRSRSVSASVASSSRSASVDLPWSMWAMMEKLRIRRVGVDIGAGRPAARC